jgi:hypothetical protein
MPGPFAASTARLAHRNQLARLMDPVNQAPKPPAPGIEYPLWVPTDPQEQELAAFTARRVESMRANWSDGGHNDARFDDNLEALSRAARQNVLQDEIFAGLKMLVDGLAERNILEDTLVMVMSEMTRSPMRNAFLGKDHWPHANAMFIGGGISGNRVMGGTTDLQESLPIDLATGELWPGGALVRHYELIAGTLAYLDVDPERWLPGVAPWGGLVSR